MPEHVPGPRATDDDRQVVVTRLREAAGRGQIDLDELEERIAATYAARTVGELVPLTADLEPAGPARPPLPATPERGGASALDDPGFRSHFTIYCAVIGFLCMIWLITGAGHPWPLYPAGGWGIGLVSHWQGVTAAQRRLARGDTPDEPDELGEGDRESRHRDREHRMERKRRNLERRGVVPPIPPIRIPGGVIDPMQIVRDATGARPARDRREEPADRRFVVAEFIDVVGSTSLNEALGDEGWVKVRARFRSLVDECVRDTGGFEANTAGDGVLVRFEHPNDAVRCGVEILRRLERQRNDTGFAPSVRIGIHSGDAVTEGDDIIGTVVNLASRVTGAADADELVCTEHVADHLDGNWATRGKGLHTLKGVNRPRHLLAIDWR